MLHMLWFRTARGAQLAPMAGRLIKDAWSVGLLLIDGCILSVLRMPKWKSWLMNDKAARETSRN